MKKNELATFSLKNSDVFLFDLDGTLYFGNKIIDGAKEALDFLRENKKKIIYLTNNSSRTDDEYYERLTEMGLYKNGDYVYSSLDAFIDYALEYEKSAKVYVLASKKVKKYLNDSGINVVSPKNANTLLTTFDKTLNFKKIVCANNLLKKGVKYIATHPDVVCPAEPYSLPDLGSFTQMFKAASGREPDVITGKPFGIMAECIIKKFKVSPENVVMIGDRLSTDIAFGVNADFKTVLVYSGETDKKAYKNSKIKATYAIDSVKELKNLF